MERSFPSWRLASLGLILLVSACDRQRIPPGRAVLLIEQPVRTLDPLKATDAVSQKVLNLTESALLRLNEKLEPVPDLAQAKESVDHRRFEFTLLPSARFQDGSAVTASDVLRSFEEFREHSVQKVVFAEVASLSAPRPDRFVLTTRTPQPFLLLDIPAIKIRRRTSTHADVSAGPFKIIGAPAETRVLLERIEKAPDDRVTQLELRYVADDTTRFQLFERGDGNVLLNALSLSKTAFVLDRTRRQEPGNVDGIHVFQGPSSTYGYLCFRFGNPILARREVRRAIAHAINIDSILKYRLYGIGTRARGMLAEVHGRWFDRALATVEYDPKRAEELLDQAGFPRDSRTGWRFSLRFKTTTEKYGNEMAQTLAGELRKVGIDVRLQVVDSGTFFADLRRGDFDLFHSRWVGVSSPAHYFRVFHSSQIESGLNRGGYRNPVMDRWIDLGMKEPHEGRRIEIFQEVQRLAADDLPYVSLWHTDNVLLSKGDLGRPVLYPNGDFYGLARSGRE